MPLDWQRTERDLMDGFERYPDSAALTWRASVRFHQTTELWRVAMPRVELPTYSTAEEAMAAAEAVFDEGRGVGPDI